jgi:hypothetical protein
MNPAEGVFLYSPVPYWVAFVLLLYRHDLSRLRHPFRDGGAPKDWWVVLNYLGLLDEGTPKPSTLREILPYVLYLSISAGVSLSWILRAFPPFLYYLIIVQGISGIVLTAATMQYLGNPPRRPFVDVLRYPRLGSRIRHLPKLSSLKEKAGGQPEPEAAIHTPTDNTESQEGPK